MPPFMAQGANQGFEDAMIVTTLITNIAKENNWDNKQAIASAFEKYERLRRPFMEYIQEATLTQLVLGLSDWKSSGQTENEALENLQQLLQKRLQNSKIVTLEIDSPQTDNPWMKVAGMYNDNPLFDEVLAHLEAERGG